MTITLPERVCGQCSECCKGYLTGIAHGYHFSRDNQCHFLDTDRCGGGCSIYDQRPEMCSSYQCEWLRHKVMFPNWMKPDKSKVIVTHREVVYKEEPLLWWSAVECDRDMDAKVLSWLVQNTIAKGINLHYMLNQQNYYLGSSVFYEYLSLYTTLAIDNPDVAQEFDAADKVMVENNISQIYDDVIDTKT